MLTTPVALNDVGQAIQLALAPVFLLTGIAGTLNVMTGRLARIIDRGRWIVERHATSGAPMPADLATELRSLERRRHLASAAITATTSSALLVCTVVAMLFVEVLLSLHMNLAVGVLFAGSSLALVVGLAYFLREVHLATKTVRIPTSFG
ncbi:MAG: DUF2721 domain-containing protein [Burkholderiaceae bacterium]